MRKAEEIPPCCEGHDGQESIARTNATGTTPMLPVLASWSSSFVDDLALAREDLLGSLAHVTMLGAVGLLTPGDCARLRDALFDMLDRADRDELHLPPGEEDVHMAIEGELTRALGDVGKRVHTARSRPDQGSTALRLHVRDRCAAMLREVAALLADLAQWADEETAIVPAFTHRQRAQPVSARFLLVAWAMPIARAGEALRFALTQMSACPLGSGACSGTSLPIDRALTARLLRFDAPTVNALDTVGDRDFELDFAWAGARVLLALSRLAADVIDFSSQEFGYVRLGDAISAGSSMMPQKKNPDIFELVRGKSALGVANLVHLLTLVKGLPTGYNRDLQDDRRAVLGTAPLVLGALGAVRAAIPHLSFDDARCRAGLADGATQATDLAEALVKRGVPFREAYRAVGAVVRAARDGGTTLATVGAVRAREAHPGLDDEALGVLVPERAVEAKRSTGGTSSEVTGTQVGHLRAVAHELSFAAQEVPSLAALAAGLREEGVP